MHDNDDPEQCTTCRGQLAEFQAALDALEPAESIPAALLQACEVSEGVCQ